MEKIMGMSKRNQQAQSVLDDRKRKPYSKPYLSKLGDLRTLTLGPSILGNADSACFGAWNVGSNADKCAGKSLKLPLINPLDNNTNNPSGIPTSQP
jgi:hypothetical protein